MPAGAADTLNWSPAGDEGGDAIEDPTRSEIADLPGTQQQRLCSTGLALPTPGSMAIDAIDAIDASPVLRIAIFVFISSNQVETGRRQYYL